MNRLEMIYQDDFIEVYYKEDFFTKEYYMTNSNKVIARCHLTAFDFIFIDVKSIRFEYVFTFREVIKEHMFKI